MSTGNTLDPNAYYAPINNTMKAFDALPKIVRKALANADVNWTPQLIHKYWVEQREGYRNAWEIVRTIRWMEATMRARYDAQREQELR
jgi:Family of unknown function (DUF6525)